MVGANSSALADVDTKYVSYTFPIQGCDQRTFCFIWLTNRRGGLETLLVRKAGWLREHGYKIVLVTVSGPMDKIYGKAFDLVINLSDFENDFGVQTVDEFSRLIRSLVGKLAGYAPLHLEVFDHRSLFIASELTRTLENSTCGLYLVANRILGEMPDDVVLELSESSLIYGMCESCFAEHEKKFGLKFARQPLLPLPAAVAVATRESEPPADVLQILTVTRLDEMKEYVEGLIRDLPELVKRQPGIKLVIVGDGPHRKRLETLARELGTTAHVSFEGARMPDEVIGYYQKAHVFVGMGTTILEAAAQKIPVVVAFTYEPRAIGPGFFGSYSGYEVGEYAERLPKFSCMGKVEELLQSPALRSQMGELARKTLEERFSIDVVMPAFVAMRVGLGRGVKNIPPPPFSKNTTESRRYLKRAIGFNGRAMAIGRVIRKGLLKIGLNT